MEKKHLLLVLPCLGIISLQTRTKLQQELKGVLNCCKLKTVCKCQTRFPILSVTKTLYPKNLFINFLSGVVFKFLCGHYNESYFDKSIRYLDIRSREHVSMSPLARKKVKPSSNFWIPAFRRKGVLWFLVQLPERFSMTVLEETWNISMWNPHSLKFLKKLLRSLKLLVGVCFIDQNLKDQIFWELP